MDAALKPLSELLLKRKLKIAVAESCTGGWLGKLLTDLPGSSAWFVGGIIAYNNDVKRKLLGVDENTLSVHSAVSEETVTAMCAGALKQFEAADLAVGVSGIAGPTGEPVGKVCYGVQVRNAPAEAYCTQLEGNRDAIRARAADEALAFCYKHLTESE